jgi:hypothetical protein
MTNMVYEGRVVVIKIKCVMKIVIMMYTHLNYYKYSYSNM